LFLEDFSTENLGLQYCSLQFWNPKFLTLAVPLLMVQLFFQKLGKDYFLHKTTLTT